MINALTSYLLSPWSSEYSPNAYIYETCTEFLEHYVYFSDLSTLYEERYVYWNLDIGIFEVFNANIDHLGYILPWVSLKGKGQFVVFPAEEGYTY